MTFSEAMEKALKASKYNFINGKYEDLGEKIAEIILKILKSILSAFNINLNSFPSVIDPSFVSGAFMVIAIIAVVAVVSLIIFFIIKRKRKKDIIGEIFDDYRSNKLSYDEIMELAEKSDRENNWRQAVRYRYIGMIILFGSKEIVNVTDSMTGTQFMREAIKNAPHFSHAIESTVNIYYALYFGHKAIAEEIYARHMNSYNSMTKEAEAYEK